MYLELSLACALIAVGCIIFGRFEEGIPRWRRILKLILFVGVAALISKTAGREWSLVWIFGGGIAGLTFHIWWCKKNGIGIVSAEPREKYYQLRGWKWPS